MKTAIFFLGMDALVFVALTLVIGLPAWWSGDDLATLSVTLTWVILACNACAFLWMLLMRLMDWGDS